MTMKSNKLFRLLPLFFIGSILLLTGGCSKDNPASIAVLTTTVVSNVTPSKAETGGNITSDGGAAITDREVCWSTAANPTIADSKTSSGSGTGTFISELSDLAFNTLYNFRAYA